MLTERRTAEAGAPRSFRWEAAGGEAGTGRGVSDLEWSTFIGGEYSDVAHDVCIDHLGFSYIVGTTQSSDFPTTAGAYDETQAEYTYDAFVVKIDTTGSFLVYGTYLGGDKEDWGRGIAVDDQKNAYLTGLTASSDFPTTAGAYDRSLAGTYDVFVAKLNPSGGALVYSTYLGGDDPVPVAWPEMGYAIALDAGRCAYVAGQARSTDFPITPGVFDTTADVMGYEGFVTKFSADGSSLEYSTFLGGSSYDRVVDIAVRSGYAYVTGMTQSTDFPTTSGAYDETHNGNEDAFVCWIRLAADALQYSTFLGGSAADFGCGIALDSSGYAYVTGHAGPGFPTTSGAFDESHNGINDAFITKVNYWGTGLAYSTFVGGGGSDSEINPMGIACDVDGEAYLTGKTSSSDFPTTPGAYDSTINGSSDFYLVRLNSDGDELLYGTYIGGSGTQEERSIGLALDSWKSAVVVGYSPETDFPTTAGCFDPTHNGSHDAVALKMYTGGRGDIAGSVSGDRDLIGGAIVTAVGPSTAADTTGPNGGYHIPELKTGTYIVTTTAVGYYDDIEPGVVVVADEATAVNACLTRQRGAVEGTVALARGPIEGAEVTAVGEVTLADTTDASGYYILEDLPTGLYDITAEADGYNPQTMPGNEVVVDDTIVVDFALDLESGTVEGIVSGPGGALSGAIVMAEGAFSGCDTTDPAGHYIIDGLPYGDYDLHASAPGHHTGTAVGVAVSEGDPAEADIYLDSFNTHLLWSTFIGGADDDESKDLFVRGSVFLSGITCSPDFPTTTGAYDSTLGGDTDIFVAALNSDNSTPFWITLLGGSSEDEAAGIVVNGAGFPFVTGTTESSDFPTTAGAFDESYNGDKDAFVTQLMPGGNSLAYSTYIGGSGGDEGRDIDLRVTGEANVTGATWSLDFPTTPGAYQPNLNGFHYDAFACQLDVSGSTMQSSTYLGGEWSDYGTSIVVGASGDAFVTGYTESDSFPITPGAFDETYNDSIPGMNNWDGFVTRLEPGMAGLAYSTYLGGEGNDEAWAITLDGEGNAYIAGETNSQDFPVTPGAFDTCFVNDKAFITKLSAVGSSLVYSTFLGGSAEDEAHGIAVDDSGFVYVTGQTESGDFPTTIGAFDEKYDGPSDAFAVRLLPSGEGIDYSTFLGGRSDERGFGIGVGSSGRMFVAGRTESYDFPVSWLSFDNSHNGSLDAFVLGLDLPEIETAVDRLPDRVPPAYGIEGNRPNPFNPSTRVTFHLRQPGAVDLTIHDVAGRLVAVLLRGFHDAGTFTVAWNGRDREGRDVSSGVYFVRLKAGGKVVSRKITLVR
ncbi:MAG: SBBP repeat-containing protein [Candidatus Eisenbacteria bacterium]|nr:SBBP repeat-containing protein [Candidatus Eisenbacteria bacterium]